MAATRKVIILSVSLLLCSASLWAAPNYDGVSCHNTTLTAGGSVACSAAISVTAGRVVHAAATMGAAAADNITVSSCSDSNSRITWTRVAALHAHDPTNGQDIDGCWGVVNSTGTTTPQINYSVSTEGALGIIVTEYTGTATSTPTDGANSNQATATGGSTNGVKSGQITTTVNGDLLVGAHIDTQGTVGATFTAGTTSATFTQILCDTGLGTPFCVEWGVQTTAGAGTEADATLNDSDAYIANILAIKAAATASPAPPTLQTMGVGD